MALLNFDASTVTPAASSFEPLPAGIYVAHVVDSEVKTTKAGTGKYLQLTWEVLDGTHAGRKVFDRLNIQNPNETAQQIGLGQLSQLCHAVGLPKVQDSMELHARPCRIKVAIKQNEQFGDSNEIKKYEAVEGARPPAMPTARPPAVSKPAPWATSKAA